jgi:diguanylate cyclase (GGDEF)-like protein
LRKIMQHDFKIAIDDFGTGYSGLKLLYHAEPHFIKIDRFFINGISHDPKKQLFIRNLIKLTEALNIKVIAEGIESKDEFYVCKEMGCHYVQGYFVQRPTLYVSKLLRSYPEIRAIAIGDKRDESSDENQVMEEIEYVMTLPLYQSPGVYTDINTVFDTFRQNMELTFLPVTNHLNEPVGIIRETDLRKYIYSNYGRYLLQNRNYPKSINDFITEVPFSETKTSAEELLTKYALDLNSEGVILTRGGKFFGFLRLNKLLKILHKKNMSYARDQNPLTRLPGNIIISEQVQGMIEKEETEFVCAYFDFDNFKPFNDSYGFRLGDRAITLFADILRKFATADEKIFIGHVGGDDFFLAYGSNGNRKICMVNTIAAIKKEFANSVKSLYSEEDRERGEMVGKDRDGNTKIFKLLTVSAGLLVCTDLHAGVSVENVLRALSDLKKYAKADSGGLAKAVYAGDSTRHGPLFPDTGFCAECTLAADQAY